MQVEDVARVGLAARRAAQQQRHLAVRLGLLRQVVVDDQRGFAVLHPLLTHGATGVRGEVLERAGIGRRAVDDDRVLHGAGRLEVVDDLRHRRRFLADADVDALHPQTLLVDDRVDGDGGLARLAVADDELALTTTDRGHGVDDLDAGLQRLLHRLAIDHTGRLDLDPADDVGVDRALAVDGLTEGVHDATEQPVADRNGEDAAGGPDGLALFDLLVRAEHDGADRLLVEVQGQTELAVLELQQLVDGRVGQPRNAGDSVAHLDDVADRVLFEGGAEPSQPLLQNGGDVVGAEGDVGHGTDASFVTVGLRVHYVGLESFFELIEAVPDAAVDDDVADGGDDPAENGRVDDDLHRHLLAGGPAQGGGQPRALVLVERNGGTHFGHGFAALLGGLLHQPIDDGRKVATATGSDNEADERRGDRRCLPRQEVLDDALAPVDGDGLIGEGAPQAVVAFQGASHPEELVLDGVERALGLGDLQEGLGVGIDAS